jgi:hypothetical protein
VVTLVIALTVSAGMFAARASMLYYQNIIWPTGAGPTRPWSLAFFLTVYDTAFRPDLLEFHLLLAAAAWPWLTMATLLVFRASMRRVHVRPAHVLRCVVYSGDVFSWTGVALVALAVLRWYGWLGPSRMWDDTVTERRAAACFLLLLAVATYRLGLAYRHYLRFDHPWSTAVASQVVVLLILTTALSIFYGDFWKLMPGL